MATNSNDNKSEMNVKDIPKEDIEGNKDGTAKDEGSDSDNKG